MKSKFFDLNRRYVRVTERHPNGMVGFEFSIGEPEMAAELIMPQAAFDEFCLMNHVIFIDTTSPETSDDWNWSLHDATHQRFR